MCNLFIIRNAPTKSERHLKAISIIYMVLGITWNILTTHSNGVLFINIYMVLELLLYHGPLSTKAGIHICTQSAKFVMLLFYTCFQGWWLYVLQPISWLIPGRGHFSYLQQSLPFFTSLSRSGDPMEISLSHMNISVDFDILLILFM